MSPYDVYQQAQASGRPLKFQHGDEKALSVVIYSSVVTLDATTARRIVEAGTLLCKITSTTTGGLDKYGPYLKTASDGRESLDHEAAVIAAHAVEVTLGDMDCAGWFMDCVFDKSGLTMGGVSLHGTSLTALKAAFPQCEFRD